MKEQKTNILSTPQKTTQLPKHLWKQISVNQIQQQSKEESDIALSQCKKRSATISNFLKDLHIEMQSNNDSQLLEIFDIKYSESFRSLRSLKTEHSKQMGFFVRILVKRLKEICGEITGQFNKFIKQQQKDYKALMRLFQEYRIHYQNQINKKDIDIRKLELKVRENQIENKKLQEKTQFEQKILQQNIYLKNSLRQINKMMKCLNNRSEKLQQKIDKSNNQKHKQIFKQIQAIRASYDKKSEQLNNKVSDLVSDEVVKYINKFQSARQLKKPRKSEDFDFSTGKTTVGNSKILTPNYSPKSNSVKRFQRKPSVGSHKKGQLRSKLKVEDSKQQFYYLKQNDFVNSIKIVLNESIELDNSYEKQQKKGSHMPDHSDANSNSSPLILIKQEADAKRSKLFPLKYKQK